MKKKLLIIIISSVLVVLAAVGIIIGITLSQGKNNNTPTPTQTQNPEPNNQKFVDSSRNIKVVGLEGGATVTDEDGTSDVYKGMNFFDGDIVNVNQNSVIVIKFDSDKYLYVDQNSKINIKSEGKDKFKTNIFVEKGLVLAEIQNKLGQDEEFFLSSNNSVMAVRGTTFGLKVEEKANSFVETYSVYKGVTELVVFDKLGNNIIKGKLTNLLNTKVELTVPKDHILENNEFNGLVQNWLKDIEDTFNDPVDANDKLDEVNISVSNPTKEDYDDVMNKLGNVSNVSYSSIEYSAEGYIGKYDGKPHKAIVNVTTPNAKIYYKLNETDEYEEIVEGGINQEENKFEFTNVGSYRVYFKIECEGYETKEDYEVIMISKADIAILENGKTPFEAALVGVTFLAGAPISTFLDNANIDISNYYDIYLAEGDTYAKYEIDLSTLVTKGTKTYQLKILLPDEIKDNYNDASIVVSITASEITFVSSWGIVNNTVDFSEIYLFNKYNGIGIEDLFSHTEISDKSGKFNPGNFEITYDYEYDYIMEGFYELKEGENNITLLVSFTKQDEDLPFMTVRVPVQFYYEEKRSESTLNINPILTSYGNDNYCYTSDNYSAGRYTITGEDLKEMLGITSNRIEDIYINPTFDYYTYAETTECLLTDDISLSFDKDKVNKIELVLFNSEYYLKTSKTVYIFFAENEPNSYPTYTISDNLVFKCGTNGANISFIESTSPVVYSTDGENYTANLVISEPGNYKVYYKIGDDIVIEDYKDIVVRKGQITSDNLYLIENTISILSNDGHDLKYMYSDDEYYGESDVISDDGSLITSKINLFEVYSNMLKNSIYYDDMTNEVINAEVTVVRNPNNEMIFDYEISADNYETVTGSITFAYSEFGMQGYVKTDNAIVIYNPSDIEMSASLIDTLSSTPIELSIEENGKVITSSLYSSDYGKTWTTEPSVVSGVGEYYIYVICNVRDEYYNSTDPKYQQSSDLSKSGNYIIAIQKIVITE